MRDWRQLLPAWLQSKALTTAQDAGLLCFAIGRIGIRAGWTSTLLAQTWAVRVGCSAYNIAGRQFKTVLVLPNVTAAACLCDVDVGSMLAVCRLAAFCA